MLQLDDNWLREMGPITGLDEVDRTLRDLVTDWRQLAHGWTSDYWEALPEARWTALTLVDVAAEAHREAEAGIERFRRALPKWAGAKLVQAWSTVSSRLRQALDFLPPTYRQRLRTVGLNRYLIEGERLHLAHRAVRVPWAQAVPAVQEYAQLLDAHLALDAEHRRRWSPALIPGIATFVLATDLWGSVQKDRAFGELESYLPIAQVRRGRFGTQPEEEKTPRAERQEDLVQDLRTHAMDLVAKLRGEQPSVLLARLYDQDHKVTHLSHAAMQDFKNRRDTARHRDRLATYVPALEDTPDEEESDSSGGVPVATDRKEGPDPVVINRKAAQELGQRIRRLFRHTKAEARILETLLANNKLDPRDKGYIDDLAKAAGCTPKTVSRYLNKLKARSGLILKAF